ncbi:Protein of unknown function [Lactobacillus helveticus CIRM-BIA 953]|uniref:Uncharacterized protein n=1 Tax=Lactobacillus helveticus CIRM-BIA 953 TaxID=1226335 RepID=U4QLZ1_LACHE|nr:Protein of unknown function [Lactobacillus helveticus CIRM-BIA 953]
MPMNLTSMTTKHLFNLREDRLQSLMQSTFVFNQISSQLFVKATGIFHFVITTVLFRR